ncbi:MAG: four helix bundle protein [bacterium]|nr:four helix bundle protein [bacterium]
MAKWGLTHFDNLAIGFFTSYAKHNQIVPLINCSIAKRVIKRYLQLNDIDCYKRALALSNYVWDIIIKWDYFAKNTVGMQFTTAVDSISANIAEGFGRYGKKDKVRFYYYSFGSMKESLDWNEKAKYRKLLTREQYEHVLTELQILPKEIHQLIKFTNIRLKE